MGFSFRSSKSFGPFRVNFSKSGVGVSAGVKGLRVGVNAKGRAYTSASIPGTGIGYRASLSKKTKITLPSSRSSYQALSESLVTHDILGFSYDVSKYRESDGKGCVKFFVWVASICAIPFVFGIFTTIGLIAYTYFSSKRPKKRFTKHFWKGYSFAATGKYSSALLELQHAEKFQPDQGDLLDLIGVCSYKVEDYQTAKIYFNKALQTGKNKERHHALYVEALRKLDDERDYPTIIQAYKEYLKEDPDEETLFLLGYYNYRIGDYDQGLSYLQKIPKESDYYLKAIQAMATCFYSMEKPDLAIEALNRAPLRVKNLTDDLLDIHYALGCLYEEIGENEQAKTFYQRVYLHDINYKDVKTRLESLNEL